MKVIKDERGFGLIEVIIVAAIISIIALGIGTMISDMFAAQQKTSQVGSLNSIRSRLIETLNSPNHWQATVDHTSNTASLGCLRDGTGDCTTGTTGLINIIETGPTVVYNSGTATAGYRLDGTTCNTFSTSSPDPTCPFRWEISWTATCTSGPCKTPDIDVEGQFLYAAGPKLVLGGGFNPTTYSFEFRRGAQATRSETVIARYVSPGNTAGTTTEPGLCNAGWTQRLLSEVSDPANIGATVGSNALTLPAGGYTCRVLAPGFRNGGNRIRLTRVSGAPFSNVESGNALATLNGGSVTNIIDTSFRVNAAVTLRVDHSCTQKPTDSPWGPGNIDDWSKGVPLPGPGGTYTGVTFTRVVCTRTAG